MKVEELKRALRKAKERELQIGIFIQSLFATKNEEQNLDEIAKVNDEDLDLVGIIIYGPNKTVDKAIKDLKFHS
jgi:hypothetical protein